MGARFDRCKEPGSCTPQRPPHAAGVFVLAGVLLSIGACNQDRGNELAQTTTTPEPKTPSAPAKHIFFNAGYGPTDTPDALGRKSAKPDFLKGHSWITKKAMEHLEKRGLLPAVLNPDRNKNFLYYGTAYADWLWMGRPETPDEPVWSPIVKSLNAAWDLYQAEAPSTPSCPYNTNCSASALQSLCATFRDPAGPYSRPCDDRTYDGQACALCALPDHLKRGWLSENFGKIALANCANFYPYPCPTLPQNWAGEEVGRVPATPYMPGTGPDPTYDCLRGGSVSSHPIAHQPCMRIASAGYRKEDVDSSFGIGVNLKMNITAMLGIGNATTRARMIPLYGVQDGYGSGVGFASRNDGHDLQVLEANLPFHQNPAVLFRMHLGLGGDGGWVGELFQVILLGLINSDKWNSPTIQDFGLDNLSHYALSDILQYDDSAYGAWGQPRDPLGTDAAIRACNDLVNTPPNDEYGNRRNRYDGEITALYEWCLEALSPYGTSVLGFPFRAADFAAVGNDYPNLKQEALYQLNLQPAYGRMGYGAAKYGAILYQFARKFFKGSPHTPAMRDMIKAGNDIPGWETGGTYGAQSVIGGADFSSAHLEFPHTYLGGNPFICSGGTSASDSVDSCASGDPTWPTWLPDAYDANDRDGFLGKLRESSPAPSNRAALIYLGWASHFIQDLALPHHASNWSGLRHAAQDSYGEMFAMADALVSDPSTPISLSGSDPCASFNTVSHPEQGDDNKTVPNNINDDHRAWMKIAMEQFGQELDNLANQMFGASGALNWSGDDIDLFCRTTGLSRSSISDRDINWNAVYTAFLRQGQTAFASRQMGTDDQCSPYLVGYSHAKKIIQNAILATMKLVLCAAPHDNGPATAPDQIRAIPVHNGVDLAWQPVSGANGYVVYVAKTGSNDYTVLGEVTDPRLPSTGNLTDGTGYTIIITAKNANDIEGPPSATVGVNPHPAACPTAPQLWAEPGNESVVLHFTPMPETAYRYHVYTTLNEDPSIIDLGSTYEPTFTAPITGYDSHYFWVKGENNDCATPISNIVATAWGMGRLPEPKNFAATPLNHGADLFWDPVEGAAGYVVFVSVGDSDKFVELGTTTGQDATGLSVHNYQNGKTLSFFVSATTAFGVLGYRSETRSIVTGSGDQPSSTQLWAQPGDRQVTLRWLGVPHAAYYNVWMKTDASASYTNTACWTRNTTCTVPGLENGTTYTFAVEGANTDYPSENPLSNTVPVSPNSTVLPYPTGVRATPVGPQGAANGYIDLTWDHVPGAAKYVLYRDVSTSGPSSYQFVDLIDPVPANQVNFYGLRGAVYGTSYNFALSALDGNGVEGTWRWPVSATGGESPDLLAPTVTADADDGKVTLTWTSVPSASIYWVWAKTEASADFTDYEVWKTWILSTADSSVVVNGLDNGVAYNFWVQAGNSASVWNEVPVSAVMTATPNPRCPGQPSCSGHGTCHAGVCACETGYSSADCSVTCPGGPGCSGHGTCTAGVCECAVGYSGASCSTNCGPSATCPNGAGCTNNSQCATRSCVNGTCKALGCAPNCTKGTACGSSEDCGSRVCSNGTCQSPSCSPSCRQGSACGLNADCASSICSSANSTCQPASCAPRCNQGAACGANGDCASGLCSSSTNVCLPPACSPQCSTGSVCGTNDDCLSKVCTNNLCTAPTCSPRCSQGASCGVNGDCLSRVCTSGTCRVPACSPNCSRGAACGSNTDCTSRVCSNGVCG